MAHSFLADIAAREPQTLVMRENHGEAGAVTTNARKLRYAEVLDEILCMGNLYYDPQLVVSGAFTTKSTDHDMRHEVRERLKEQLCRTRRFFIYPKAGSSNISQTISGKRDHEGNINKSMKDDLAMAMQMAVFWEKQILIGNTSFSQLG